MIKKIYVIISSKYTSYNGYMKFIYQSYVIFIGHLKKIFMGHYNDSVKLVAVNKDTDKIMGHYKGIRTLHCRH